MFLNTAKLCDRKLQRSMGRELGKMAARRSESPNAVEFGVSKWILTLHLDRVSSFKP